MNDRLISNARERRKQSTASEGLLWSVLRARQLCSLKFRREHPIAGYVADFACEARKLIVEIDGGYHDQICERDLAREETLRKLGWDILRFTDKDVEDDVEAIGRAIATHLGLEYSFRRRRGGGSGRKAESGNRDRPFLQDSHPSPKSRSSPSTLPREGEGR